MNLFLLCMISCTIAMFPYPANFISRYGVPCRVSHPSRCCILYILSLSYDSLRGEVTCNIVLILGCGGCFSS